MARYLFPNLTESLAALVSTHGYFEIVEKKTFNGYRSSFGHIEVRDRGGEVKTAPPPVVIYAGSTDELGIPYNGEYDDLELPVAEEEEIDYIQGKLLEYLKGKEITNGG